MLEVPCEDAGVAVLRMRGGRDFNPGVTEFIELHALELAALQEWVFELRLKRSQL
jgi:hypothetical protein